MRGRGPWIVLGILVSLILIAASCSIGAIIGASIAGGGGAPFGAGDAVALVPVEGTIQSGEASDGLFSTGGAFSGTIRGYLQQAQKDSSIKAIVLLVDSPGGGVTASEEIYDEILRTKQDFKKKIVVSMGSLAASGGYYISAPADRIVAYKSTLTGSIGVISLVPNYQSLLDKVGVEVVVFKSGPHKDESYGLRPLTPEEEAIEQSIIDDTYNQFVDVVVAGRNLDRETVLRLADGRVYTGSQAKDNGLVDELGTREDAIRIAADLAGIKGKPRIVEYKRKGFFSSLSATLFGPAPQISFRRLLGIEDQFGLQYLYIPSTLDK